MKPPCALAAEVMAMWFTERRDPSVDVGKPETHAGYQMPGVPPKEMSLSYDTGAYPTRQRPTGFKILGRKPPPLPR
jgi:hypothetical protein